MKNLKPGESFFGDGCLALCCRDGDYVYLPVEEILKQANVGNYDLIVMGMHGHGFLFSALIGSTSRKMVKQSEIPVLVVRLPEK